MLDPMQYGFLVGRHLSETHEKSAVNLGGIGKFLGGLTGAADTASTAKPAVAAAGSAPKPMTVGPGSFAAPAVNQARAAAAANPHAQMPGGPIKMAPPLTSRPAAQLPSPPKPAPGKITITPAEAAAGRAAIKITPQDVGAAPAGNSQFARMMYDNAQSGGRNQMLGYGQRGGPSSVPQKWDQLTPEQQATVNRILGAQ